MKIPISKNPSEGEQPRAGSLLFGGLFSRLFGASPSPGLHREEKARPLEGLEQELHEMTEQANARLRKRPESGKYAATSESASAARLASARELLLQQRENARQSLEAHIGHLHSQLGTGIDAEMRERLLRLLAAHSPAVEDSPHLSIEERIERSVLRHLFLRASEAAWLRFENLMAESGLVWPAQEGLAETLTPEELHRLREKHRDEIRLVFLAAPPEQQADLIRGDGKAWMYSYPARGSYLWLQTALRGVAAALCAQYFAAALELWMWRSPDFDRKLVSGVDEKLRPARDALQSGIQSLADAMDISSRVNEVCQTTIPAMVWTHIAPQLNWVRSGEAAPTVSVLAQGLSQLDPVCGMFLTSERVAERAEIGTEIVYLCSSHCRQRFEASPSLFHGTPPPSSQDRKDP